MSDDHQYFMRQALIAAKSADGEIPVGAIVVHNNKIIASSHNRVEELHDPTAHAEILAIRQATTHLRSWRLTEASLYVTLEPCIMCIGAILHARIPSLFFGAYDPVQGAVGSLFDLSSIPKHPRKIEVFPEILAADSQALLSNFFASKRS